MKSGAWVSRKLPHPPRPLFPFLDFFPGENSFSPPGPTLENAVRLPATLHYPQSRRSAVAAILRQQNESLGAGPAVLQNIARFEQGSAAVVTGQQFALFGGPADSVYKVLSALETVRQV